MAYISSTRNRRIRHALRLRQGAYRREHRQTLIEGPREIERALQKGVRILSVYVCPSLAAAHPGLVRRLRHQALETQTAFFEISEHVHQRLAMRGGVGGIVVEAEWSPIGLEDLPSPPDARYVVLEDADRPGNIGAVLRTVQAVGATALVLAQGQVKGTDLSNPNVIRASLGAVFEVPTVQAPGTEVMAWLRRRRAAVLAVTPEGRDMYAPVDMPGQAAFVFGSEAAGLSTAWKDAAHAHLAIPMAGAGDSLNLSVSVAVVLYEFLHRRRRGAT